MKIVDHESRLWKIFRFEVGRYEIELYIEYYKKFINFTIVVRCVCLNFDIFLRSFAETSVFLYEINKCLT